MTEFVYPDSFQTLQLAAQWIAVVSTIFCVFLMLSWVFLPVEKTARHYLSICLTIAVVFMNVSCAQIRGNGSMSADRDCIAWICDPSGSKA
jgi:hypothetical protein